jgi:hypothetical protein
MVYLLPAGTDPALCAAHYAQTHECAIERSSKAQGQLLGFLPANAGRGQDGCV